MQPRHLALLTVAAAGPTFAVNATGDQPDSVPGDGVCKTAANACTLRAAVDEANLTSDARITIPAIAIALTGGDLVLAQSMTISGAGMRKTVIKAAPASRIFTIVAKDIFVSVEAATLRDGALAASYGGAIAVARPAGLRLDGVLVDS